MKIKFNEKTATYIVIFGFIILAVAVTLFNGLKFSLKNFSITETALIEILVLEPESIIFLDDERVTVTREEDQLVKIEDVHPGTRQITVAKQDHWPWAREILIEGGEKYFFTTLQLSQTIKAEDVSEEKNFENPPLTDKENAPTSPNGEYKIWPNGGHLILEWQGGAEERPRFFCDEVGCRNSIIIFKSDEVIKRVDFWPGKNNLAIFDVGNRILAIELIKSEDTNIQPIYEGDSPDFLVEDNLYIRDGENIYKIEL